MHGRITSYNVCYTKLLRSHLLTQTVMDSCAVTEMVLAQQLIEKTPDNSLTLFDKSYNFV